MVHLSDTILQAEVRKSMDAMALEPDKVIVKSDKSFLLKSFARELWKIFNNSDFDRDIRRHLNINTVENLQTLHHSFSRFIAPQVYFYISKYLFPKSVITTGYEDGDRTSPSFTTFYDRNGKPITCIEDGFLFINAPFPFVLRLDQGRYTVEVRIIFSKNNFKKAEKIFNEIKENTMNAEFFKGATVSFSKDSVFFLLNNETKKMYLKKKIEDEIETNLLFLMRNKDKILENNLPWKRGVLLYGYPGTGKTQLSKIITKKANESGVTSIIVTPRAIESPDELAYLFNFARYCSPSLIVFEDIDLFAGARDEYHNSPGVFGEFLQQMDGIANNNGIFVIATTNRPFALDKAVSDRPMRFDSKIHLDYNDYVSKRSLIELFNSAKLPIDADAIAAKMENITPAHIQELLIKASLLSLQSGRSYNTEEVISLWNSMRPNKGGSEVT